MSLRITEDPTVEGGISNIEKTVYAMRPDIEEFSEEDRPFFRKYLPILGKEPRLSNITKDQLHFYLLKGKQIFTLGQYPMLIYPEFLRKKIGELDYYFGVPLSLEAKGFLYGPMAYQMQHVKQEIISQPEKKPI